MRGCLCAVFVSEKHQVSSLLSWNFKLSLCSFSLALLRGAARPGGVVGRSGGASLSIVPRPHRYPFPPLPVRPRCVLLCGFRCDLRTEKRQFQVSFPCRLFCSHSNMPLPLSVAWLFRPRKQHRTENLPSLVYSYSALLLLKAKKCTCSYPLNELA